MHGLWMVVPGFNPTHSSSELALFIKTLTAFQQHIVKFPSAQHPSIILAYHNNTIALQLHATLQFSKCCHMHYLFLRTLFWARTVSFWLWFRIAIVLLLLDMCSHFQGLGSLVHLVQRVWLSGFQKNPGELLHFIIYSLL